jgi:hypothetical protein
MTTEFRIISRPDGSRKASFRSVQPDGACGPWHRTTTVAADRALRSAPALYAVEMTESRSAWRSVG